MPNVRTPSGSVALKGIAVRTSGGLQYLKGIFVRDPSGAPRSVLATLAASAAPAEVYGYGYSVSPVSVTTQSTTVSVTGGVSPTIAWTGGDGNWTITSPTSFTTAFRRSSVGSGADYNNTFTWTVADGAQTISGTVYAEVANNYG